MFYLKVIIVFLNTMKGLSFDPISFAVIIRIPILVQNILISNIFKTVFQRLVPAKNK